ncbi:hypothetical protein R1sor_004948 [Riccia sorocarpa]|uniref:Uncharacterized protein n=1 Tax=Riccia sorocarpa TaxID=122646 RepID=A0ABD3HL38_9MARC
MERKESASPRDVGGASPKYSPLTRPFVEVHVNQLESPGYEPRAPEYVESPLFEPRPPELIEMPGSYRDTPRYANTDSDLRGQWMVDRKKYHIETK